MTVHAEEGAVAFYVVVDGRRYLPKAITALRSFQRFHPEAGYLIVGSFGDDERSQARIKEHGLDFLALDLSHVFSDTVRTRRHRATWPSECFWWTHAYEPLAQMGYTHSCSIDGDVLCVAPLCWSEVFPTAAPLAGVARPNGRINSGVLFCDNAALQAIDFAGVARRIYRQAKDCEHQVCTGYCRTKGDQGLLWEIEQRAGIVPARISNRYNHMLAWDPGNYAAKNPEVPMTLAESRILHLLLKPWRRPPRKGELEPVSIDGYHAWWRHAADVWPSRIQRSVLFGRPRRISPGRS